MTKLKSECPYCQYTTSSNKTVVDGHLKRNRRFNIKCYSCRRNYYISMSNNEYHIKRVKKNMATEFLPIKTLKQIKREYQTIHDKLVNLQTRIDNLASVLHNDHKEVIVEMTIENLELPILEVEIEKIDNLIHFLD